MSVGKIWFVLRKILKWKSYVPVKTTVLTPAHKQTRFNAAQWFLSHDVEFFSKQVIWSDEKYLKQVPNRKIHRYLDIERLIHSQRKVITGLKALLTHNQYKFIQNYSRPYLIEGISDDSDSESA